MRVSDERAATVPAVVEYLKREGWSGDAELIRDLLADREEWQRLYNEKSRTEAGILKAAERMSIENERLRRVAETALDVHMQHHGDGTPLDADCTALLEALDSLKDTP